MLDVQNEFGPFGDNIWLNCAHQGPIPRVAAEKAHEAIRWKQAPFNLTTERFSGTPQRLRTALSQLLNTPTEEIILGNSASYGLHLLANGLPLNPGDEVLLTRGDFPSVIYPWLGLEARGIVIRFVEPANDVLTAEELAHALSPATKVFCATWVHSFSGNAIDLDALGRICKKSGVTFIANTTQAVGTRPLDLAEAPVDAIVNVGFKWLCGPYGTGFCWMRRPLLESLQINQTYWLSLQTADDLGKANGPLSLPDGPATGRTYDIFGTANFFNYVPWTASLEFINSIGIPLIAQHNQHLVGHLIKHLDASLYNITSPRQGPARSTLVLITHRNPDRNQAIYDGLKTQRIHLAFRRGRLRLAPHLYNSIEDIDTAIGALHQLAGAK